MACMYVTEQGSKLSFRNGKFIVDCRNGMKRMIPAELLESAVLFGRVEMTSGFLKQCLARGVSVSMLSSGGHYFGRLESTSHTNADRLKSQVYLSDDPEQTLTFAKISMKAKIHNQEVLLRRYSRNASRRNNAGDHIKKMSEYESKIDSADSVEQAMGYEGLSAREYFAALSELVRPSFSFRGRNKRPPKDPFNSMLSLGYTIVFYEIYAEIEAHSLNPYIGFVHKIKEHHPALVSDMLEEWRAVIVDAVVMNMVQRNEIDIDEFETDKDTGGVIIGRNGVKTLVADLEKKMQSKMNYLDYLENPVSFRRAIWWQARKLAHCVDINDLSGYQPLRIR